VAAALIAGFLAVPWVMVSIAIPLFVVLPMLKVFVSPAIGPVKDGFSFSALIAATILAFRRRTARREARIDRPILVFLAVLFALYLVNIGGLITGESGHNLAWFQGVRLFCEPLALLLAGLSLREPARTLAAARKALIASAVACAIYGVAQQGLGVGRLEGYGYVYGTQIRQITGHIRSFGTLDDPFLYASFLLLGLATILMSRRLTGWTYVLSAIVAAGLVASFVRTAAVVALGVVGLALGRRGHGLTALFIVAVAIAIAGTTFVLASDQTSTRTVNINPTTYVTLNGRTQKWRSEIGSIGNWPFGRGVAVIGSAAQRAQESLTGKIEVGSGPPIVPVDSGYFTLIGDVGLFGLVAYLALLSRIVVVGRRAARRGYSEGWLAISVVVVMLVDAVSRETFTGYPIAYLGMLMAGLACSAAQARVASSRLLDL
jgi:hypothetical protein